MGKVKSGPSTITQSPVAMTHFSVCKRRPKNLHVVLDEHPVNQLEILQLFWRQPGDAVKNLFEPAGRLHHNQHSPFRLVGVLPAMRNPTRRQGARVPAVMFEPLIADFELKLAVKNPELLILVAMHMQWHTATRRRDAIEHRPRATGVPGGDLRCRQNGLGLTRLPQRSISAGTINARAVVTPLICLRTVA